MKGSLHLIDAPKSNNKTLFFDNEQELEKYESSLLKSENNLKNYNFDKERLENIEVR